MKIHLCPFPTCAAPPGGFGAHLFLVLSRLPKPSMDTPPPLGRLGSDKKEELRLPNATFSVYITFSGVSVMVPRSHPCIRRDIFARF